MKARLTVSAILVVSISLAMLVPIGAMKTVNAASGFNAPGNILITDQFNSRVIEINLSGNIVWTFGNGHGDTSANAIAGTNDAERVPGGLTLISGTGIPPGVTTNCKKSGCVDNRVLLVDKGDNIVWQYGQFGVTGFGPNQLNTPVQNTYLPNGHILITDQGNERIIEVDRTTNSIVWQYGQNGIVGIGPNQLSNPNSAELLKNGNILIADENNNRAIEVTHNMPSIIVATFTNHGSTSGVAFASRLDNGDTLITDSNNARIVEVNAHDDLVWQYFTNTDPKSNTAPLPTRAVELANGNVLISDQFNDRVIEITNPGTNTVRTVASYGVINDPGFSPSTANFLNGPYSAYVIGDYTGTTNPFGF